MSILKAVPWDAVSATPVTLLFPASIGKTRLALTYLGKAALPNLMGNFLRIIAVLAILLGGSRPGLGAVDAPHKTISFTDAFGKRVELSVPARRIVTNNSHAAEIISALGEANRIVGIADYMAQNSTELLSGLKGRPDIGRTVNPSIEKILELQPDLVIVYDRYLSTEELEGKLAPLGIPVARLYCYRLDLLGEEISILGKIVGREKLAEKYLQYYQRSLEEVQGRLKGLVRKIRFYGEAYTPFTTYSRKSWANLVAARAGLENLAADQPVPFPKVASEWVVSANPEVIIKAGSGSFSKMGYGTDDLQAVGDFRKALMHRPAWDQIDAVKSGRVYLISNEIWTGPRVAVGILYMAKWCYPERFRDIEPEQVHREWLWKWHHQELKGIYVYP